MIDHFPECQKTKVLGNLNLELPKKTPVCHHQQQQRLQRLQHRALGLDIPELPSICPGSWGRMKYRILKRPRPSFRSCGCSEWVSKQNWLQVAEDVSIWCVILKHSLLCQKNHFLHRHLLSFLTVVAGKSTMNGWIPIKRGWLNCYRKLHRRVLKPRLVAKNGLSCGSKDSDQRAAHVSHPSATWSKTQTSFLVTLWCSNVQNACVFFYIMPNKREGREKKTQTWKLRMANIRLIR